jgi:hydrogenase/urease accessory protein HupE
MKPNIARVFVWMLGYACAQFNLRVFGVSTNNKIQDEKSINLRSVGAGWGVFSEAATE